ncbi:Retinol dehydrogenase 13 [Cytospora mali]|uniref:3beta-hydroxysteroid 3-dehydrogenase n=1 Tax=Cytospora mali TaxID=578113 RepID=A0A194WA98_CYTMA|nr:Retinol dehydrogenase 13 [Valsa mali]
MEETVQPSPPPRTCKGTVIVTGANGGLGRGYITALTSSPHAAEYRGIYTDRDDAAAKDLDGFLGVRAPGGGTGKHQWETSALDLCSLAKIRAFAASINARVADGSLEPIRALVLVAGYLDVSAEAKKPLRFTEDGYEAVWGINYLANFLLVLLLLRSMDKDHGRVVMVSSWSHNPYDKRNRISSHLGAEEHNILYTDTDTLAKGVEYTDDGEKAGLRRYGASKACLVMFMFELQRRINADPDLSKICVIAMEPGAMVTSIATGHKTSTFMNAVYKTIFSASSAILPNGLFRTPERSGQHLLRACFDTEELGEYPKATYLDGSRNWETGDEVRDEEKQRRLWADSLTLTKLEEGETVLKGPFSA